MRHASAQALDRIEPLLAELRTFSEIVERKRGIWYLRSRALLHFHEDPAGVFADLKVGSEFQRFPVNTLRERRELVRCVRRLLADPHRTRS
jgi:hypothetical protein